MHVLLKPSCSASRRPTVFYGWSFYRPPMRRGEGRGYLPRAMTRRLARKGGSQPVQVGNPDPKP